MERKRLFEPGDLVSTFAGDLGLVLSEETLKEVRALFKEGNRPGRFFAPGCCQNPDYVTQVPVFFEDGTYDVMRAMNVTKKPDLPDAKREELEKMMDRREPKEGTPSGLKEAKKGASGWRGAFSVKS